MILFTEVLLNTLVEIIMELSVLHFDVQLKMALNDHIRAVVIDVHFKMKNTSMNEQPSLQKGCLIKNGSIFIFAST